MAGLLGNGWDDPQSSAIMALSGGLLRGDFGGGLLGANSAYQSAQMHGAQRGLMGLQSQEAALKLKQMQQAIADDEAAKGVLRGVYGSQGMPGGAGPVGGPTNLVNAALPPEQQMGAMAPTPQFQQASTAVTPKADVWGRYKAIGDQMAAQGLVKQAQTYYDLAEKMRPKYNTTPQQMMVGGKLTNVLVGEDGSTKTLDGFEVKPDMVEQDLGGVKQWVNKNALTPGQTFQKTMTPGEAASNSVAWANYGVSRDRLNFDKTGGAPPSGYRVAADGKSLEFVPGGPADPNAAKRAAPTEFQGKSTTFAARMQDAAKVIDSLEGKVMPFNVARVSGVNDTPVVGGAISALNRLTTSGDAQRYAQAQENWVTANLRQESGAAIGKEEMEKDIRKWFPQPGDSDAVKKQKAEARKVAERAMVVQSGPGASSIPSIVGGGGAQPTVVKTGVYGGRKVQQMSDGTVRYAD